MSRFSAETESVLLASGWFPGRQVDIRAWQDRLADFAWHAAAVRFLTEFGGISVDLSGPGVTCAREPFVIDPALAIGEEQRFEELSERFGLRLFPIGEFGVGDFFLGMDEYGVLYLLAAWAFRLGAPDEALENLIKGVRGVRMSAQDQDGRS
ncbi:SUKH-3 domain-containing protein [Streptomyces incarnatus]|uniref:SUKH-3 domain-containing protein n=1 Tax=Streptomyces incarnatus TaxID=665007 RepID=UPI001AD7E825|nr:SUKH-3 domain-containing protein [Streptomyces incarnatus]